MATQSRKSQDAEIINRAKKRIASWYKYWAENNENYKNMTGFVILGKQWSEEEESILDDRHKTPFVMNKLQALMNNIVGEQRQNTPSLQVRAITDDVSDKDIELRQKIVKTIAYKSDSKVAYQTAFECALAGGYGVFKVANDYESELTFNQTIKIEPVQNPIKCFFDPSDKSYTKCEGGWQGMHTSMNKERFKKKYPGIKVPDETELLGSSNIKWATEDDLMIVDYLEKKEEPIKILQLDDGSVMTEDEYKQSLEQSVMNGIEPAQIINTRKTCKTVWMRYKIAGDSILERSRVPGKYPIYIFMSARNCIDAETGKQVTPSFFDAGKDPQKLLNYSATQTAYLIKTQRADQWLSPDECIEGHETIWEDPEIKHGVLPFNPYVHNGALIRPERVSPESISPELFAQYDRSQQDIYTCIGVYEAQTGQQGNEVSRVAIDARTQRGNVSTYSVFDNLNRSIAQAGNVISSMMPDIIPNQQTIFVDDEDAGRVPVTVNQQSMYGNHITNDLSRGEYLIIIEPAGTFDNQKREILAAYELLLKYIPAAQTLIADKVAENLPVPAAKDLKKRLEIILDPRVAQMEGIQQPPSPPNPMAMLEMQKMKAEQQKQTNEQSKQQLEAMKIKADMQGQQQKSQADLQQAKIQQETEVIRAIAEILNAAVSNDSPVAMAMARRIFSNYI